MHFPGFYLKTCFPLITLPLLCRASGITPLNSQIGINTWPLWACLGLTAHFIVAHYCWVMELWPYKQMILMSGFTCLSELPADPPGRNAVGPSAAIRGNGASLGSRWVQRPLICNVLLINSLILSPPRYQEWHLFWGKEPRTQISLSYSCQGKVSSWKSFVLPHLPSCTCSGKLTFVQVVKPGHAFVFLYLKTQRQTSLQNSVELI